MSIASFEQIELHNGLLQTAVKEINTQQDENPLCDLFKGIKEDLVQTCCQLPKEVSDETGKKSSEKIYARLRTIADFLDPALPGYFTLKHLMSNPPMEVEEEEIIAEFTDEQKNFITCTNFTILERFRTEQNHSIFSIKAVKNTRHGIPILTRMGTLVGRLSLQVVEDKTCAKTLEIYELIKEHWATSYPGQLTPKKESYFAGKFGDIVKILPTTQDELSTLMSQGSRNNSEMAELTKKPEEPEIRVVWSDELCKS